MKLNEKIIVCRKQKGYSQEELASLLGVSRQSISKWETGESLPDINKLMSIAKVFDVTTDWLLTEDNIVTNEEPEGLGGAIYIGSSVSNSKINSTFINNTAYQGGAIFFNNTSDNVIINNPQGMGMQQYIVTTSVKYEYGTLTDADVQANIDAYIAQESSNS